MVQSSRMPVDFDISPVLTPPPAKAPPPVPAPSPTPMVPSPIPTVSQPPTPMPSSKMLKWLMLVASGLIVVTVAALWFGSGNFATEDITVTLEAPQVAASGDSIRYTITVVNGSRVALHDLSFRLFYPGGTLVLVDGKPQTRESEGFTIDDVEAGATATKTIEAILVGDQSSPKLAKLNLIFQAGTLRSSFEKEVAATTFIGELPVRLTVSGPPSANAGQDITYFVDVRNSLKDAQRDLRVNIEIPEGFRITSARPEPDNGTTWDLDELDPDEGTRITIVGTLTGAEQEVKTLKVQVQRLMNGEYIDVVREETSTMISSPLLSVAISPDQGREYVAFPGDSIRYVVTYVNNSRYTFNGILIGVKLEGEMYDTARIQAQEGFYDESRSTIVFDSTGIPELAALQPGASGRVSFTVPLFAGFDGRLSGAGTTFVKATASIVAPNVPSGVDASEVSPQDVVTTKIGSQPALSQLLLYDDGVGEGSLPPKVGEQTTFTIRWQVTNPGNDIQNAAVTATLAPGVVFIGDAQSPQGQAPTYDRASGTVTWKIGTVPYGTGNGTARYEATFKLGYTPSASQTGDSLTLTAKSVLTGSDGYTSLPVNVSLGAVSTLDIDGHTDSDGKVVQP